MRRRWSLRYKIVLPFFVLLAFVGMIGTILITERATTATVSAFEGNLLRASLLSNDHLAVLEAERLAQLRAAVDTEGVSAAVAHDDTNRLISLLTPIQANASPDQLTIRVLDPNGNEELTLTPAGTTKLPAIATEPDVQAVLAGQIDPKGDKYVFSRPEPSGMMLYWVGPVHSDTQPVGGAILLGESLPEIADSIRDSRASDLVFYDPSGQVLLSSMPGVPPLSPGVRRELPAGPVRISQTLNGHPYEFLVGDWRLRASPIGYLASALAAGGLEASIGQIRLLMMALFGATALMTLVFGTMLARRITRPVEQLVASTVAVAKGDLTHRAPIASNDEIATLAESFNAMAASLEQKTRQLEESYFSSMESLARAIDARDPSTFGHSRRVADISLEIGRAMGLRPDELDTLRRAALLHDMGKIGVEDRVLRKTGPLSDEEWDEMKEHPRIGYRVLSGLSFLRPSLDGVLHHHERWDGGGYPDGLKAGAISAYVRVLTLADVLDAMTSERPYHSALPFENAVDEVRRLSGAQFDPEVVEAFLGRTTQIAELLKEKAEPAHLKGLSARSERAA